MNRGISMNCYIVLYELNSLGNECEKLHNALRKYVRWGRLTENAWVVVTDKTHLQIIDELRIFIKPGERLLVIKNGKQAAWLNAMASSEWLSETLSM